MKVNFKHTTRNFILENISLGGAFMLPDSDKVYMAIAPIYGYTCVRIDTGELLRVETARPVIPVDAEVVVN